MVLKNAAGGVNKPDKDFDFSRIAVKVLQAIEKHPEVIEMYEKATGKSAYVEAEDKREVERGQLK